MKISHDMTAAAPAKADFGMLRASLMAAQAATPTALASASAPQPGDRRETLARIFDGDAAARLGGSFAPPLGTEQER